jgi:Skp family chaperone for outer membrane proteins
MCRPLVAPLLLLMLTAAGAAHAVTKCQGAGDTLYTAASCPAGYRDVTSTMRGNVTTVTKSARVKKDEQAHLENRAQMSRQIQNWDTRDEEVAWRAQNAFWNQCRALEYQARASERAMQQTEYWSRADRYRDNVRALRAEQYELGCFY